jgi:hypothetical protein
MPDVEWNHAIWDAGYRWVQGGDEWSAAWGGARSQWMGTIYPRIATFLPANRILEIAPGQGRWSQFLVPLCTEFIGVDLSLNCIQECKRRFAAASRARFVTNDGISLRMVEDDSIDFVFSFDSLVHAELDVMREYTWQILQKLTGTGAAFLHHSNGCSAQAIPDDVRRQNRAQSVSTERVKEIIEDCSGRVLIQEEITWAGPSRIDCITTFCKSTAFADCPYKLLQNDDFLVEARLIRAYQSHYSLR